MIKAKPSEVAKALLDNVIDEFVGVELLSIYDIKTGDIAPETAFELEKKKRELAEVLGQWINSVREE